MSLVSVDDFTENGWTTGVDSRQRAAHYCERLEAGEILYFPESPFPLPLADQQTLLTQKQSSLRFHKNVSYQPLTGKVRGLASDAVDDLVELRRILGVFSDSAVRFVESLLLPYIGHYSLDFASYRPVEEQGRPMSLHKRNDLLHVDAFPNRPTAGGRILRVFTNINPEQTRDWVVTDGFEQVAEQYADRGGILKFARRASSPTGRLLTRLGTVPQRAIGKMTTVPTPYDRAMHRFHNHLKENSTYQEQHPKEAICFPPGSSWVVFTDYVPHAVLRGRFALEQTFIVRPEGMVRPDLAPIRILERLAGRKLAA